MEPGDDDTIPSDSSDPAGWAQRIKDLIGGGDELSDRYETLGPLGRGGMGSVVDARDRRLHRRVAVKALRVGDPDHADLRRFLQEAQITSQLEHPNIPPVHDVGVGPHGMVFFTMKRVQGRTLQRLVDDGDTPLRQRLSLFTVVCDAVAYAHDRGVLHRDLKPANIMIGTFGRVWVIDWGLAKLTGIDDVDPGTTSRVVTADSGDGDLTTRGDIVGTPHFMSPEQARGAFAELDERADIYSLGVVLYVLLTGTRPFDAKGAALLLAVQQGEFPPPRTHGPVPWALEQICLRAMAHDPADRYPSVAALRADLQAWLEGELVPGIDTPWARRFGHAISRHGPRVALAATALGVAGTLAMVVLTMTLLSVRTARDRAVASEREAQRALAQNEVAVAIAEARVGRVPEAFARIDQAETAFAALGDPGLSAQIARGTLSQRYPPADMSWSGPQGMAAGAPALSQDGTRVAATFGDQPIQVVSVPFGEVLQTHTRSPSGFPDLFGLTFVYDRLVAVRGRPGAVRLHDLDADRPGRVIEVRDDFRPGVARLSGDGGTLALYDKRQGSIVYDAKTGAVRLEHPNGLIAEMDRFGRRALTVPVAETAHRRVDVHYILDLQTGERLLELPPQGSGGLTPDGTHWVRLTGHQLQVIEVDTGEVLHQTSVPRGVAARVTGDGTRVVVTDEDGRMTLRDLDGLHVIADRAVQQGPTLSSAGLQTDRRGEVALVARGNTVYAWQLEPGSDDPTFVVPTSVTGFAMSADDVLFAAAGWDGTVRVVDWRSGWPLATWTAAPEGTRHVAFADDGAHALTADRDGGARWIDVRTGDVVRTFHRPDEGIAMGAVVIGDSAWVGYETGRIVGFDVRTGAQVDDRQGTLGSLWHLGRDAAGERILATGRAHGDAVVEVWDVADASAPRMTSRRMAGAYRGDFAADGGSVVVGIHRGELLRVHADGRTETVTVVDEAVQAAASSPDGQLVAIGTYDGHVDLYATATGSRLRSAQPHERSVVDLRFVRGGEVLLSVSGDGVVRQTPLRQPRPFATGAPTPAEWLLRAEVAATRHTWRAARDHQEGARKAGAEVPALDVVRAARFTGDFDTALAALDDAADQGAAQPATLDLMRRVLERERQDAAD